MRLLTEASVEASIASSLGVNGAALLSEPSVNPEGLVALSVRVPIPSASFDAVARQRFCSGISAVAGIPPGQVNITAVRASPLVQRRVQVPSVDVDATLDPGTAGDGGPSEPQTTQSPVIQQGGNNGLVQGAAVGAAVGGVCGAVLLAVLGYLFWRRATGSCGQVGDKESIVQGAGIPAADSRRGPSASAHLVV